MAWTDRLRQAAYTSPSGVRLPFIYEDVQRTVEKKTTGFEFPDADGTYVQDLGRSGRRYPLQVIFWGDDCDLEAESFEAALLERGIGTLDHPIYGALNVVPFGAITRRDDLKTQANQVIITVTFWESTGLVYPSPQTDPGASVITAVSEYNDAAAVEFEEYAQLDSAVEQASGKSTYEVFLDDASSVLRTLLVPAGGDVAKQFNAILDSIDQGIDTLIAAPLTLAFQTALLLQAPARALAAIEARLDAYKNLARSIVGEGGEGGSIAIPGIDSQNANDFFIASLYASTYVTGSIVSVVNNEFETKTDAIQAAETILEQFDDVTQWRDANFQSLASVDPDVAFVEPPIDTGGSYQKLQKAVALVAGFLVEISFSLKQERRIVLDRDRTIIDLAAELYGEVDAQLDFLINSNNLSGSEILELPRGREIVYYV